VVASGPELNAACAVCVQSTNGGLWDLTDLTDPTFVQMALRQSPDPRWLATGWVFPVVAYYPSLIGVQCLAFDAARSVSTAMSGRVPRQLANPTSCESTAAYKWPRQPAMTKDDFIGSIQQYALFTANYRVSPETEASVSDMAARARAGGTNIVFLEPPLHPVIGRLFPGTVEKSKQAVQTLASGLNMSVVDLSGSVPDDPSLWVDAFHLDRAGADYLTPQLATALAPILGG
jgi:hypothetical protein